MKYNLFVLLLFISFSTNAQKWHLERINEEEEYKYEYWFQFENLEDSSSYEIIKATGDRKSLYFVTDNLGDSIFFSTIKIKNLDSNTDQILTTGFSGVKQLRLLPGRYEIELHYIGYDKLSAKVEISPNEYFTLKAKLGLAPSVEVYQINSKVELTETEIRDIINCVKFNGSDYFRKCSIDGKYFVGMHI